MDYASFTTLYRELVRVREEREGKKREEDGREVLRGNSCSVVLQAIRW